MDKLQQAVVIICCLKIVLFGRLSVYVNAKCSFGYKSDKGGISFAKFIPDLCISAYFKISSAKMQAKD